MANPSIQEGDFHVRGQFSAGSWGGANAAFTDSDIASGADIAASKLRTRFPVVYRQSDLDKYPSPDTYPLHIAYGSTGSVDQFQCCLTKALPTGTKTLSIDLLKGSSGSTYSSILSAKVTFTSTDTLRGPKVGTLSSTAAVLTNNDTLAIELSSSGSSGTLGEGFIATAWCQEKPL
jgi:hypothetical protein